MSESIGDNPNRRLSHAGVAAGDFAHHSRHRRDEGKRFDLATVLLYAILSMVAGANSYRQMHDFIRIHLQRLNEAFGLRLRYSPSYTGLRLIIQGVDPTALEAAFRQHALSTSTPPPSDGLTAIAVDGKRRLQIGVSSIHAAVQAARPVRTRTAGGGRDPHQGGQQQGSKFHPQFAGEIHQGGPRSGVSARAPSPMRLRMRRNRRRLLDR